MCAAAHRKQMAQISPFIRRIMCEMSIQQENKAVQSAVTLDFVYKFSKYLQFIAAL